MSDLRKLLYRHQEFISYSFWGIFAVAANVAGYLICSDLLSLGNAASTVIAWFLSVLTAFVTNKYFVFESRGDLEQTMREFCSFTGFRMLSGTADLLIMLIAVDSLRLNPVIWKLAANAIVIAMNYVFSKCFIFKKEQSLSRADS